MVRLKGKRTYGWNIRLEISIPYGAIKRKKPLIIRRHNTISIPYGAIKRHKFIV